MSEEEQSIVSMTDDQFTEHVESLSPDEAQGQIDRVSRAAAKDPNHPYMKAGVGHKRAVERMSRYFEQKHSGDDPGIQYDKDGKELVDRIRPDMKKLTDDAMAAQATKQNKLVEQGDALLKELRALGFEEGPTSCDEDVDAEQIAIWKMQKLNGEENYRELGIQISEALRVGKEPAGVQQLFSTFLSIGDDINPVLKQNLSHEIISYLNESAKVRRAARKNTGFGGTKRKAGEGEFNLEDYR